MTEFSADYRRWYGLHTFEDKQGRCIDVVSEPDWGELVGWMRPGGKITGNIAVTPELITLPSDLHSLADDSAVVSRRVIEAQILSARSPMVTWLLGTPTMPEPAPLRPALRPADEGETEHVLDTRPRNSLVAIKDMVRVGAIHKQRLIHNSERAVLQGASVAEAQKVPGFSDVEALVCSDLVLAYASLMSDMPRLHRDRDVYVSDAARTLLVRACWAVPQYERPDDDALSQSQLETAVTRIFEERPNVHDVIVADRNVPGSNINGPFNVHFQRV